MSPAQATQQTTRRMLRKCSLYVAKNITSSAQATQQTQRECSGNVHNKGKCSENVFFMSLKTLHHQTQGEFSEKQEELKPL